MADRTISLGLAKRPVFVASTGGHLEQLHHWARRWGLLGGKALWVTFRNEQSEALLKDETKRFVPYVAPRDIVGAWRTSAVVRSAVRDWNADVIVSTGAAVAVSAAVAATTTRTRYVYIESLARVDELSLTGRILNRWPSVERYTQSPALASRTFTYSGSVMSTYTTAQRDDWSPKERLKVLVTVGTIKPYGFDRLLSQLDPVLQNDEVIWQTGESDYVPSHGVIVKSMDRDSLVGEIQKADVVISHGGVGSILSCLANGKVPIIVTRLKKFGEHVDDHQQDIARLLSSQGLIDHVEVPDLNRTRIAEATRSYSVPVEATTT